jgi:hypothetical protein
MDEYHQVGQPFGDEKPAVFELRISDHITNIDPSTFGVDGTRAVDPHEYFITSGDAVQKAKVLERDLWKLAGELRKESYTLIADERHTSTIKAQQLYRKGVRPKKPGFSQYEAAVWKAAGQSRKLVNNLRLAKGEDCFLETEWDNHQLLCIPKNPRR